MSKHEFNRLKERYNDLEAKIIISEALVDGDIDPTMIDFVAITFKKEYCLEEYPGYKCYMSRDKLLQELNK